MSPALSLLWWDSYLPGSSWTK